MPWVGGRGGAGKRKLGGPRLLILVGSFGGGTIGGGGSLSEGGRGNLMSPPRSCIMPLIMLSIEGFPFPLVRSVPSWGARDGNMAASLPNVALGWNPETKVTGMLLRALVTESTISAASVVGSVSSPIRRKRTG